MGYKHSISGSKSKSNKKRHSASITLKVSSMSDSHLNYKHTNNPPLQNGFSPSTNKAMDDNQIYDINNPPNIDMNELIQSVKDERQKQIEEDRKDKNNKNNKDKEDIDSKSNGLNQNDNDNDKNLN